MTTDDDVITRLVAFHDHIQAPPAAAEEDALRGRRRLRRRRTASLVAAVAALAVTAGIAQSAMLDSRRAEGVAGQGRAPERVRAEGALDFERLTSVGGITVRVYAACDGQPCDYDESPLPERVDRALEVVADGRSAVFGVAGRGNIGIDAFDDDSVLVADAEPVGPGRPGSTEPARYRLLHADGTEQQLRLLDDPVPISDATAPGAGVVVHGVGWRAGGGGEALYVVDQGAGTLRPLELPPGLTGVRAWGPDAQESLWGVTADCRVVWQRGDGTVSGHRIDCQGTRQDLGLHRMWFPDGWLRPGRMVAGEQRDDVMILHVSLDHGTTWQQIRVRSGEERDAVPITSDAAIRDALAELG